MKNENTLHKGSLGLFTVIFFVIAAASPLTGIVGAMPLNFMFGNGAGVPGSFIVAAALLIVFSFGFVAMSKYVVNAGAFYTYIVQGLGVGAGISGLSVAMLAYAVIQISVTAMFGFFAEQLMQSTFAIYMPWWVYGLIFQVAVTLLGIAKVEIGGRVLGGLMLLEVSIILLIDFMIFRTPVSIELSSFQPSTIFSSHFGISMVFAICSFVGFEAAAIYSEECVHPDKVVGKATFTAVLLIALFFVFSTWSFVLFSHAEQVTQIASQDPGMYVYNVAKTVVGQWAVDVMSVLLLTSLFASAQAFHNSLSRYMYSISRDGLCWAKLAKTHPTRKTPYVASVVQGVVMMICLLFFAWLQLDPMVDIFSWCSAFGSLSILLLQLGVSLAVISYFKKNTQLKVSRWSAFIAPSISSLGMIVVLYLVVENLDVISGSNNPLIYLMPIILFLMVVFGLVMGAWLKRNNGELYNNVGNIVKKA